ncbi:MAG: hypothetical protein A2Y07_06805 [Planctomycetes bacterium GWF2_50_10]|nr:MAG: hypothetical protein A2Y07_06805 [Planctomycetes bacterium GWF2_50_10]
MKRCEAIEQFLVSEFVHRKHERFFLLTGGPLQPSTAKTNNSICEFIRNPHFQASAYPIRLTSIYK